MYNSALLLYNTDIVCLLGGVCLDKAVKRASTNHDTGFLGIIAVVCMIIDHVGVIFFPGRTWLRVVGRIALPLFAWGIAVGAEHTRSLPRYAMRLFALMCISQIFYMRALNHTWDKLNIFSVLFLGLIGIWGLKENKGWMTVVSLLLSHLVPMDYGLRGVLCILLLWAVHDNPLALAVCFSAYCVVWGETSSIIWHTELFDFRLQSAAILALPLMLWPRATRLKTPKWLMYAMYPGHLAILWALKAILL